VHVGGVLEVGSRPMCSCDLEWGGNVNVHAICSVEAMRGEIDASKVG